MFSGESILEYLRMTGLTISNRDGDLVLVDGGGVSTSHLRSTPKD